MPTLPESSDGLEELRARVSAAASAAPEGLARATADRLGAVLDLIESGRGRREAGSGLNPASRELLIADALLTEASAEAAAGGASLGDILRALDLAALAERARRIDESPARAR